MNVCPLHGIDHWEPYSKDTHFPLYVACRGCGKELGCICCEHRIIPPYCPECLGAVRITERRDNAERP